MDATVELTPVQRAVAVHAAIRPEIRGDSYIETVMTNLGLTEFPDGKVLDIGAGTFGELQSRVRELYPKTELISLNPHFGTEVAEKDIAWVRKTQEAPNDLKSSVAGIAQELPFKTDSFDLVISHAAVPVNIPKSKLHYETSFSEAIRVAKPDAKIIFAPMEFENSELSMEVLEQLGVEKDKILIEQIPVGEYSSSTAEHWYRLTITK